MTLAQLTLMAVMLLYTCRVRDAVIMQDSKAEEAHMAKVVAGVVLLVILAVWRLTT